MPLTVLSHAQQSFPLETVAAEGIAIPQPLLLNLTGLKIGDAVNEAVFRNAAEKLQKTGLFSEIGFRFTPGPQKSGYSLIFTLKDHTQRIEALFDFPGKGEEPIWTCLKQQYPWLSNPLPADGNAQEYIAGIVAECMGGKEQVVARMESVISTGKMVVVFQPRDLPRVVAIEFQGTEKLRVKTVQEALAPTALESEFTERRFRNLLELNVRPLYESHGILKVKFPSITFVRTSGGVTVTTAVAEGLVYTLGSVAIEGADLPADVARGQAKFPVGHTAEWPTIEKSIQDLQQPLLKTGYITVQSRTARVLDDSAATLALTVHVEKGPQYLFRSLLFDNVPEKFQGRFRTMWKLEPDAPMDQPYMNEFYKALRNSPDLKNFKLSIRMRQAEDRRVDVIVKFE